jgi:hypothetical protein
MWMNDWAISLSIVSCLGTIHLIKWADQRGAVRTVIVVSLFSIICDIYCIAYGLAIIGDWENPFTKLSSDQVVHGATMHGGKGAVILGIIAVWPYFLLGLGWFCAYSHVQIVRRHLQT